MKKRSIYQNRSQELYALFESACSNSKIMCIPMDFAKRHHVVMFCNGYGDILHPSSLHVEEERFVRTGCRPREIYRREGTAHQRDR